MQARELDEASLPTVRALGRELEQHVRREERELFPLIERIMPEAELVLLASRLARQAVRATD
jgi:iron-sulfur cluster repair protein YtfE (RIC family)